MTAFIVGTSERSDASIREGAKELLSARVSARANPGGAGDGPANGSGARRMPCSDTELCAERDAAGIYGRATPWRAFPTQSMNLRVGPAKNPLRKWSLTKTILPTRAASRRR